MSTETGQVSTETGQSKIISMKSTFPEGICTVTGHQNWNARKHKIVIDQVVLGRNKNQYVFCRRLFCGIYRGCVI